MIQVNPQTYGAIWGLIGLILAVGWIPFGMLGNGNQVFLTIMVILSMVSFAGAGLLLRRRRGDYSVALAGRIV